MTASEFMQRLAQELHGLSAQERDDALAYYREYFEEAGPDADAAARALGSPQIVAQRIIAEAGRTGSTSANVPPKPRAAGKSKEDYNVIRLVLVILLIIVLVPLWLTLWILWISMICVFVSILGGFAVGTVAGVIAGIAALTGGTAGTVMWFFGTALLCLGLVLLLWKPFLDLTVLSFKGIRALTEWGVQAISGKEKKA